MSIADGRGNLAINCKVKSVPLGEGQGHCSLTGFSSRSSFSAPPRRYAGSPPKTSPHLFTSPKGFALWKPSLCWNGVWLLEPFEPPCSRCSSRSGRWSRLARDSGRVPLGAKVLHCSVRRSCTARCEGLAPLGARSSPRSMRMVRFERESGGLGGLPPSSARKRVGVIGEGKNHRSERGFVPPPYITQYHPCNLSQY